MHFHVICTAFLRLIFHSEELLIFRQVGSFYPMLVHLLLAALWPVFYQLLSQNSSLKFNSCSCNVVSIFKIQIFGKLLAFLWCLEANINQNKNKMQAFESKFSPRVIDVEYPLAQCRILKYMASTPCIYQKFSISIILIFSCIKY